MGVCPGCDPDAVATKMLKLMVGPGLSVTISRDNADAPQVLTAAGFDLLSDGERQLWHAKGSSPWDQATA